MSHSPTTSEGSVLQTLVNVVLDADKQTLNVEPFLVNALTAVHRITRCQRATLLRCPWTQVGGGPTVVSAVSYPPDKRFRPMDSAGLTVFGRSLETSHQGLSAFYQERIRRDGYEYLGMVAQNDLPEARQTYTLSLTFEAHQRVEFPEADVLQFLEVLCHFVNSKAEAETARLRKIEADLTSEILSFTGKS